MLNKEINTLEKKRNRIDWIDFLKGIAILLVIYAHTITGWRRSVIFSFHMPLFFMLSGYTFRKTWHSKCEWKKIRGDFLRLFLLAYIIWAFRFSVYIFRDHVHYNAIQIYLSLLYASGSEYSHNDMLVPAFGMMWFLIVLFEVRTIYRFIRKTSKLWIGGGIALSICYGGILISKFFYLPLSLDVAMVAYIFFFIGTVVRNVEGNKRKIITGVIAILVWTVLLSQRMHFEMAERYYPYQLLSIVMASAGCIGICLLTSVAYRNCVFTKAFATIGRHSLVLFIIHAFDTVWFYYISELSLSVDWIAIIRIVTDLILLGIVISVKKRINLRGNNE